MEQLLLKPMEAADQIKVGRSRIYELLAIPEELGGIPHIRIGHSIRVPYKKLIEWVEKQQ